MFEGISLGLMSLTSSLHKVDECESNGLPRLPHSINIIGRLEQLKCLSHSNLCCYIDAKRDKHERILLVTEYYENNWENNPPLKNKKNHNLIDNKIIDLFIKIISGVEYLHRRGVIVRNIAPNNIYWTNDESEVKLANYGVFFVTNNGRDVDFPLGQAEYLPPEALIDSVGLSCPRTDVWSLAIILLKIFIPAAITDINLVLSFIEGNSESYLDVILDSLHNQFSLDLNIARVLHGCLLFDVEKRTSISKFKEQLNILLKVSPAFNSESVFGLESVHFRIESDYLVDIRNVRSMYYLWSLAGGDLWRVHDQVCDDQGKLPAILTLPIVVKKDGEALWSTKIANAVKRPYSEIICQLPLAKLLERIDKLPRDILFEPQLKCNGEFKPFEFTEVYFKDINSDEDDLIRSQPIWVKETDFEYQFRRIIKFRRLLRGYPLTKNSLLKETSFDIPPLLRAEIWPLLLNVDEDEASLRYMNVQGRLLNEKSASQISVDLPRCHSYDELIVSCTGQLKLSRILHAWLLHHPGLEYTQGMDSLCAVFTRLMFNKEALAFACLERFVDKFMNGLFCSSHGQALTEYCTILQQLLAFHKPNLSQAVNIFSITGFTASWIYTGFAHSLPIEKTLRLWDTVILGEPSFLMMVFIALLGQLDQESGFSSQATEQVFSVLSNLPEFDLDRCRLEAIDLAKKTPPSVTVRYVNVDSNILSNTSESLNQNIAAKISLEDLLLLIDEDMTEESEKEFSPFAFDSTKFPTPILIDLRKKENYEKGSISGSLNIPVMSASPHTTLSELESKNAGAILCQAQCNMKIIIGTVDDHICDMVAKIFISTYRLQYVCILKGGINEVKSKRPDILIVTH